MKKANRRSIRSPGSKDTWPRKSGNGRSRRRRHRQSFGHSRSDDRRHLVRSQQDRPPPPHQTAMSRQFRSTITVNNGPFVGKSGKHVTMNKIRDRLEREKRANISLRIEESGTIKTKSPLLAAANCIWLYSSKRCAAKTMSSAFPSPKSSSKKIEGVKHEPIERVHIEVPRRIFRNRHRRALPPPRRNAAPGHRRA